MKKTAAVALLLAVAGLACDTPDDDETGMETGAMDTASAPAVTPAPPTDELMEPGHLAAIDQSGVHGTVDVEWGDGEVEVTIAAEGLEAGGSYEAHIHEGRCAAGGPVAVALGDVVAGEDGTGMLETSATTAGVEADADHFVQLHDGTGAAVACADIESGDPEQETG